MKKKFLIYGGAAFLTIIVALVLIGAQSSDENASRTANGAAPSTNVLTAFKRTFGF